MLFRSAPRRNALAGPIIDPNSELREASAMVRSYGGRISQTIELPVATLRDIEVRAERTGRRAQPDLAGMMTLAVGANPTQAAEAFNALD